ncbi:LOW QUALITY PROTEIN: hypothetical protein CRUP_001508 [Coryphaenoides rupestris]|nr:LOW QUALITY PROTEIN: hypothetical protein CRUP_001508 [Coryphaenoides rupestris]
MDHHGPYVRSYHELAGAAASPAALPRPPTPPGSTLPLHGTHRRWPRARIPDWNRTWYTANPDLTQCFQNTVLVWVPCVYLWLLAPFYCLHLYCHDNGRIRISCLCTAKMVLGFLLASFGFVEFFYILLERSQEIQQHMVFLVSPIVRSMTVILALFIIQVERMRGCRSSVFLFLFWVLAVVCSLVPLRAKIQLVLDEGIGSDIVRYLAFFSYFTLQLAQLFLCCFADQRPEGKTATEKNPCPVKDASFLSKILFWWFAGLVVKGYRTPLEADDLWTLREEDTSDKIISDLEQEWTAECAKIKKQEKALASGVALGGKLPDQAQLLRKLQREQSSGFFLLRTPAAQVCRSQPAAGLHAGRHGGRCGRGYFYATLMFLLSCLQFALQPPVNMYTCFTLGPEDVHVGEIVNLVSADTPEADGLCVYFNAVTSGHLLWQESPRSILIFPLNGYIAKKRSKLQPKSWGGIKILKFYAWEKAFLEQVLGYREKELKALKKSQMPLLHLLRLLQRLIVSGKRRRRRGAVLPSPMFGVYVTIDDRNVLDAQKAIVSLKRLGKYLCSEELRAENVTKAAYSLDGEDVAIDNGTFSWSAEGPPCLKRINIHVPRGSLVAVVGHAWIQNATVQDNVMFGREKIKTWYQCVLEACALLPDLDILPAGDATEIGEKGLNLSGGQKQRVSLARAVYRRADVYLLDDPLSAVDAHVGQHIFDKVIGPKGVLRDKTRILVTHGMSFLPQADLILVLVDGEITESGSYQELLSRQGAFADFIHTFANSERKESAMQRAGSRRSNARLSMVDFMPFSRDLSQEQLIGGDSTNTNLQNMEPVTETDQEQVPEDLGKLTEVDKARTGRVRLDMYMEYFKTIGTALIVPIVLMYAFQQGASLTYNYWLSLWADDPIVNGTQQDTDLKLAVFGALGLAQGIALFSTTVAISLCGIIASRHLHAELLNNVLHSPMSFFECTPSGNLLNRFAKEIDAIDCMIPDGLRMMLGYVFKLLEVCVIVMMATPFAAVFILPLAFLYAFVGSIADTVTAVGHSLLLWSLEEAVSRSPIYTHFNETVQGASVIRAFREEHRFIQQANKRVDFNQTAYFPRFVATR